MSTRPGFGLGPLPAEGAACAAAAGEALARGQPRAAAPSESQSVAQRLLMSSPGAAGPRTQGLGWVTQACCSRTRNATQAARTRRMELELEHPTQRNIFIWVLVRDGDSVISRSEATRTRRQARPGRGPGPRLSQSESESCLLRQLEEVTTQIPLRNAFRVRGAVSEYSPIGMKNLKFRWLHFKSTLRVEND